MSDIGEEELCKLACSQTLDGYTPNPFYANGMCPDYMKSECNFGGDLWQDQWDKHKEKIKEFNAERVFHASMGVPTQLVRYGYQGYQGYQGYHPQPQQPHHQPLLPPTSSQVFANMRQKHPQKFQRRHLQPSQSQFFP